MILFCHSSKADENPQDAKYLHPLSPQASDFIKYGNTSVGQFTGETNVRIPIYNYSDKDFNIPIYLGYNSSGFIPNKRDGIVGLNWFLNAGGMISRKVNGIPDEKMGEPTILNYSYPHGLYYGIKNDFLLKNTFKTTIFYFMEGARSFLPSQYWALDKCEVEPDEFSVNAPGCQGEFFIENNGSVRFTGNKNYKVDLSNFNTQPINGLAINNSEIIITTDNGYKYYFGGTIHNLEVSYSMNSATEILDSSAPVIVGWHISKIVAPNGREVLYHYRDFNEGISAVKVDDLEHYLLSVHDADFAQEDSTGSQAKILLGLFSMDLIDYGGTSDYENKIYESTKTVYLEKIEIDQAAIEFSYEHRTNKFYPDITSNHNYYTMQLKNIYIKNNNVPIKTFTLNSSYEGGSNGHRNFLSSVEETGKTPYTFSYYKQTEIPDPRTHAIDYWGYWNGRSSYWLIPSTSYNQEGDFTYTSDNREPNESKCDVGLLKQVNYPTGGYTSFTYEGHRYSQRLERRKDNNFLPKLYPESGLAGGARIREVMDNDGSGNVIKKTYKYFENYPDTAISSGILLEWPRYIYAWRYKNGSNKSVVLKKQSQSFNINHNSNEKYIQYSKITEVLSPSNGYIVNEFTNYKTNPDINDYQTLPYDAVDLTHYNNVNLYNNYVGIKMNDCSFQRGFPTQVSTYSNSGTLLHKKATFYTKLLDYPDNYVASVYGTGGLAASHKIYYVPFLPLTEIDSSFFIGSNPIVTTNEFKYSNNQLSEQKTYSGRDPNTSVITLQTLLKYPYDIPIYNTFSEMVAKNILSPIITKETRVNNNTTNFEFTNYEKTTTGTFLPSASFQLLTTMPTTCPTIIKEKEITIGTPYDLEVSGSGGPGEHIYTKSADFNVECGTLLEYTLNCEVQNLSNITFTVNGIIMSKPNNNYGTLTATTPLLCGQNHLEIMLNNTSGYESFSAVLKFKKNELDTSAIKSMIYYDKYDDYGNLQQFHKKNDINTTFIYGYNNTLPIISAKNVTYAKLNVAVNSQQPNLDAFLTGLGDLSTVQAKTDWTTFNTSLRSNVDLKDALITTYTYKPLVGITSETAPNGTTTYYYYDSFGRLSEVKNDDGKILKKYTYKYATN